MVILYVDDLLLIHKSKSMNETVISELSKTFNLERTSKGDGMYSYLGMNIYFDNSIVHFSMKQFIQHLLNEYGPTKPYTSPATSTLFDVEKDPKAITDQERKRFHTFTAKLLYLCNRIRPDIALAVSYLTTRVTCATNSDVNKLDRLMGYIQHTKHCELKFNIDPSATRLIAYIDASFCVHHDGKSHSGMILQFCGATIMAKSTKQSLVSKSSTESELIALSDYCTVVMEVHDCLSEMKLTTNVPIIFQDNESVLKFISNGNFSHRTRHLKARSSFVTELISNKRMDVEKLDTTLMLADVMNKVLSGKLFRLFVDKIMGLAPDSIDKIMKIESDRNDDAVDHDRDSTKKMISHDIESKINLRERVDDYATACM